MTPTATVPVPGSVIVVLFAVDTFEAPVELLEMATVPTPLTKPTLTVLLRPSVVVVPKVPPTGPVIVVFAPSIVVEPWFTPVTTVELIWPLVIVVVLLMPSVHVAVPPREYRPSGPIAVY